MPKFVDNLCRVTDDIEVDDLAPAWPIHDVHNMGEERLLLVARDDEQTSHDPIWFAAPVEEVQT
jgi:hypothetical protein